MVTFSKLGDFGRLGNQMFQIASTIGAAKRVGHAYGFPEWKYQKYFKNPLPRLDISGKIIKERSFGFTMIGMLSDDKYSYDLQGYFQSPKYWDHCKNEVLNYFEFNLGDGEELEFKDRKELVSIHVRRGDYLSLSDYHTNLEMNYYNEAMGLFPDCFFEIFSDDIKWCKDNFKGNQFLFEDKEDEHDEIRDLYLMSKCDHNIIANSSFSWWGSYLNKNPNKKVIAPKNWFGNKMAHVSTADLIPESWIQI